MRNCIAYHSRLKICRRSFASDSNTTVREKKGHFNDLKNQRAFLDALGQKLNISHQHDWYKVTKQNFLDNGGRTLLSIYGNSPSKAIIAIYPEYNLKQWDFKTVPTKFWTDIKNQRNFLESIQIKLNLSSPNDLIQLQKSDFLEHGAAGILSHYGGSPIKMLSTVFPEISWNVWESAVVPEGYWEHIGNQQKCLHSLKEKFGIQNYQDWYKISKRDFINNGARGLLEKYQNSLFKMFSTLMKEYDWKLWLFENVNDQFWQEKNNRIEFLMWLKKELKIKKNEDWYKVIKSDIVNNGGKVLLELYEGSVLELLKNNFPDIEWLPWRFDNQRGVWQDEKSHKKYVEWLGKELNVKTMEDWYNISQADIKQHGGGGLLHYYDGSPSKLVMSVFPEYDWQVWKFARVPQNFWSDDKNIVEYSEFLKEKLQLESVQDWATISRKHMSEIGGKLTVAELQPVLQKHFGLEMKSDKIKKSQRFLKVSLSQIFPEAEIVEDYRPEYMEGLELDLFIPMHNVAFEYQGEVHYKRVFADPVAIQKRDQKKQEICKREGITLIQIGYWWDSRLDSLKATIYKFRPDLFAEKPKGEPIRETPYSSHTIKQQRVTSDKENEISKSFLLANIWNGKSSPIGWMMSEKFDGIRALWDGKRLYSRFGKEIRAPAWFTEKLPRLLLDGELWMGLGHYEESIHLARSTREDKWSRASFCVFDCLDNKNQPFEDRYQFLKTLQLPEHVSIVKQIECKSNEHLDEFLAQVRDKGGEGVMIRQPGSLYESGRSNTLLKVKPYLDTEVKFLERTNGQVALLCEQTDGELVNVACSLDVYEKPPEVNSVITVTYQGTYLSGKLKYPFYYRLRKDVTWEEVVQSKQ